MIGIIKMTNVRSYPALGALLMILTTASIVQAEKTDYPPTTQPQNADFERIKSLAGTWEGTFISTHEGNEPKPATVTYRVTAGGSAVVETLFGDTPHEMVSVYHLDGDSLVMTHYCMLANQPTMSAAGGDNKPDTISFVCSGGTNIPNENVPHMHAATFTFDGDDHVISDWVMHQDGQPGGKAHLDLRRRQE